MLCLAQPRFSVTVSREFSDCWLGRLAILRRTNPAVSNQKSSADERSLLPRLAWLSCDVLLPAHFHLGWALWLAQALLSLLVARALAFQSQLESHHNPTQNRSVALSSSLSSFAIVSTFDLSPFTLPPDDLR